MRKITIFILTSCLAAMSGCSKKEESEAEAPAPVQVTAVTQDTIRRIVNGDGMLFPRDQASVMPKIASPVEKFYVNRGDHVKQGQLLAVLESRDLTAQAAEGQGAMDQAESNLRTTSGASVPEAVVKAQTDVDADRADHRCRQKGVRQMCWTGRSLRKSARRVVESGPRTSMKSL